MTATAEPAPIRLVRDRPTLSLYSYFVVWGWLLYSFSPSVPLLADELGVSKAQGGLHGTAFAAGAILVARLTPRLVDRFGRRATLVGAGVLIAVGVIVLVAGPILAWTLTGVFILAAGGNVAVSAAQAGLSLRHGRASSAAVTEANGVGSGVGLLGPLAVGACVAAGWGWRPAVLATAALAIGSALLALRLPADMSGRAVPAPDPALDPAEAAPLDAVALDAADRESAVATRWFLVAIVAAIALENATTFWSTDLIRQQTGAGAGIATAATAGLVAGMTAIRFVVGPLSLRIEPARLLAASFLVAIVGWAILWTATETPVALAGLAIAGIGYGAQYPLSISILLSAARRSTDRAQANATLAGGAAIGVAPYVLGALADSFGAHTAFLVIPVVALLGAAAAVVGPGAARRASALRTTRLLARS
ncbi:MAG TPA: MFS transporter [Cellulomonas sp.]|uniref:MFS transporter n=1 Tax=Cellulomonas sp. TaxID=40001 RepID=UPI002E31365A|nr:MFS transporter [Cellulomonas sp.]HEX5334057.1 MFS transporter [Cellulomonas sp.]